MTPPAPGRSGVRLTFPRGRALTPAGGRPALPGAPAPTATRAVRAGTAPRRERKGTDKELTAGGGIDPVGVLPLACLEDDRPRRARPSWHLLSYGQRVCGLALDQ